MQKWEYLTVVITGNIRYDAKVYTVNDEEIKQEIIFHNYLHELGEQGWELVSINGDVYYFKRPMK